MTLVGGNKFMMWTVEFNHSLKLFKVVCEGEVSVEDVLTAKKDYLSSPYWQPGMNILADLRNVTLIYPGLEQLRRTILFNAERKNEYGSGRIAYLVKGNRDYGIARQITSLLEIHTDSRAAAFLEEDEAINWLSANVPKAEKILI